MSGTGQTLSASVAHAFNRFGLGGRPDDVIPNDPIAWLTNQLAGTDPLAYAAPNTPLCLGSVNAIQTAPPHSAQQTAAVAALSKRFQGEQQQSLINAVSTTTPFRERLVRFWANHFAILGKSGWTTLATSGSFIREAIRPFVTGTFQNMLLAVMQHPAMLASLNNDVSIGPQSQRALAQGGGFNENLGREILELFTLGSGNYTQADVDALAFMLTGWTVSTTPPTQGFVISADLHQPGQQTLLGTTYSGSVFDAYQAIGALGVNPTAYAHIAAKLVGHFVNDTPAPNDVATVTAALVNNGGSLTAAYNAIIGLSNAWIPQTKLRTPQDFTIAAWRSLAASPGTAVTDVQTLGQAVWQPPFPCGWSDKGADWASPAQMSLRTDWINALCTHFPAAVPAAVTNTSLGALISSATTAMLARVTATHDKLTILFCSPEFQRR